MIKPLKFVIHGGRKFWLQSTGMYYQDGRRDRRERLLHRVIWWEHNGPIPDGVFVHHRDGDWTNNDIKNLELMEAGEHSSMHMKERFKNAAFRKRNAIYLDRAQKAAPAWHKSKEGIEWHKNHGKDFWKNSQKLLGIKKCRHCGNKFKEKAFCQKYCSVYCRNKVAVSRHPREFRICVICGGKFSTSKYVKTSTCSFNCRGKLRSRNVKEAA